MYWTGEDKHKSIIMRMEKIKKGEAVEMVSTPDVTTVPAGLRTAKLTVIVGPVQ